MSPKTIKKIIKRNGNIEKFNIKKIVESIAKAGLHTGEFDEKKAKDLAVKSMYMAQQMLTDNIPTVEDIANIIEEVMMNAYKSSAKCYILYRDQQQRQLEITNTEKIKLVNQYLKKKDWQVNENSNMGYSLQGLNNYIASEVSKTFWLGSIYPKDIRDAHNSGDLHIHDLSNISSYCFTGDTKVALVNGTNPTFKDLVQSYSGREFWVYSIDSNNNIVPGLASNPRITQKKVQLIEVTLDNNKSIKCTPDHRFMLRDREYKEAKDLCVEDSLMPLYISKIGSDYREIYNPNTNDKQYIHRLFLNAKKSEAVHHVNGIKYDNRPCNLEKMEDKIHRALEIKKTMKTPEWKKQHKEKMIAFNKSDKKRQQVRELALSRPERDEHGHFVAMKNHKVKSIQILFEKEDVYDLTVDNYHNFALEAGVFVHNCVGWDLEDLLREGFRGVSQKTESKPPKHFRTALGQIVNFFYTLQGESAGAQAFSSFDTLLAPFVYYDKLTYKETKQAMQEFVFNVNVPTRVGFQCNDELTEILTADGWRTYDKVNLKKSIATYNISEKKIEYLPIKNFFVREYNGPMYHLTGAKIDQLVSPKHRVVHRKSNGQDVMDIVENVVKKKVINIPIRSISGNINGNDNINEDVIKLVAYLISEGTVDKNGKGTGRVSLIQSRQVHPDVYDEIKSTLDNLELAYTVREQTGWGSSSVFRLNAESSQFVYDLFESDKNNGIKFVPQQILELSPRLSMLFLETYLKGDGSLELLKTTTVVEDIRDGLMAVGVNAGYGVSSYTVPVERLGKNNRQDLMYVKFTEAEVSLVQNTAQVDYDGIIWCPTTKNETVVARRNGKVFITGNSPFTNLTFDLQPSPNYEKQPAIIGGEQKEKCYGEFQKEMTMINKAFLEVMLDGDAKGRIFTFPIPTYNITKNFNWDDKELDLLWKVTGKYGMPYFSNYINSDMNPEDARSMCCRLRLDNRELVKRGGGLFGSNPLTGCYDDQTEVLTRYGWKFWKDVNSDDEFYTRSEDEKIVLEKPTKLFSSKYVGKMMNFKSTDFNQVVTPDHNMLITNNKTKKERLVKAKDYDFNNSLIPKTGKWIGLKEKSFYLPSISYEKFNYCNAYIVHKPEIKINMTDWLRFLGIYLAEGSFDNEKNAKSHGYRVFISQTKKLHLDKIKEMLTNCGFNYKYDGNNFVICNKQLWSYVKDLGNCYTKYVPDIFKQLCVEQLDVLFEWMMHGDGHRRKTTKQENYWTASEQLRDDFTEICMKRGFLCNYTVENKVSYIKGRKIKSSDVYNISVHQTKYFKLRKNNTKLINYDGYVYCAEVPNHTLYVRRNGFATWCGNSIGVVTVNMARLGFFAKDEKEFIDKLTHQMVLARESLEIKRKILENFTVDNLYPYTKFYLRSVYQRFNKYWTNHFSTIGVLGMNEACLNLFGEDIGTKKGKKFTETVLDFMRDKLISFQKDTGNNYNLEATPAEGTSYRMALKDKALNDKIICANEKSYRSGAEPYYSNSTQLPVSYTDDIVEALDLQDDIQCKYTGGCVEKGNYVITDKGVLKIEYIVNNFEKLKPIKAASYNPHNTNDEWDTIVDAMAIDVNEKDKIRIQAERGLDITTSDWHPFYVLKEDKVIEKRADELNENDYILQNRGCLQSFKDSELDYEDTFLLGYFIGDGCFSSYTDDRGGKGIKNTKIRFFDSSIKALEYTKNIINRKFDCKINVIQNEARSEKLHELSSSKKNLSDFFIKYGYQPGNKTYDVRITDEVKDKIVVSNFYGFLSGLISSDGHIGKNGDMEYSTVSEQLAIDIVHVCTINGMMCGYTKKTSVRKNEHVLYRVRIPAFELTKYKDCLQVFDKGSAIKDETSGKIKRHLPVVRVKKASKVDVSDNMFYDLTTEKNHNYLAGKNTFVYIHNTVLHLFLGERIDDIEVVKQLIRKICTNYHLPYFSLTPTFSICPIHGYLSGEHKYCPTCDVSILKQLQNEKGEINAKNS